MWRLERVRDDPRDNHVTWIAVTSSWQPAFRDASLLLSGVLLSLAVEMWIPSRRDARPLKLGAREEDRHHALERRVAG
jgi:hypothetical protein